jgi:hypothetical protein
MSQTLKLSDQVYEALRKAARSSGMAPEGWIAARLHSLEVRDSRLPTTKAIARANARLRKQIVSSGKPGSCDNEQIDADLARENEDDHAKLYRREKR